MGHEVEKWNLLRSPVPHWAELKSCMPLVDFPKPNHVKCMKCDKIMKKDLWVAHAIVCTFQPSQCRVCECFIPVKYLNCHWKNCSRPENKFIYQSFLYNYVPQTYTSTVYSQNDPPQTHTSKTPKGI